MGVLGLLFVIAVVRMLVTYYDDQQYTKRGELPPRYQAKMAQFEAGKRGAAPTRLGAAGYFRELWHDVWDDLHGHRQRIRAERKAGERPKRRERVGVWWRLLTTPVGERQQDDTPEAAPEPEAAMKPAPAPAPVEPLPPGTKTVGDDGEWKTIGQPPAATATVDRRLSGEELKAGLGRVLHGEMDRRANLSPEKRQAEEVWRAEANRDHLAMQAQRALDLGAVQGVVSMLDTLKKDHPDYYKKAALTVNGVAFPMAEVHEQARAADAQIQDEMRADASGCLHEAAQIGADRGDSIATVDALDKLKRDHPDYYKTGKLTINGVPVPFAEAHESFRRTDGAGPLAAHAASDQRTGDQPMTTPTGEVVNHETHVAELDAQIQEAQTQLDSAAAFHASIEAAEMALDQMQQTYQAAAEAAQSKLDHTTALNLDSTTISHAGTAVDAMPPNAVNAMYEHFELMKAQATERREQAEAALAALEAERQHVISEYGEEFAKVAQNLGGDARYLDSGAGTVTTPSAPAVSPQAETANV